jgi:release factor glutamine methyltransferase
MTLQQETRAWTIRDLMKFSIDHLQRHGFDETRLTVELLLSHALRYKRIELYTHFDQPLSKDELGTFRTLYERRLHHEPVQYIVGATGFMGMQFQVDQRVFIPRPETETLVEQIMIMCNRRPEGELSSILEVGTGSGNIAIAIAKLVRNIQVTTLDINREALELARVNAVTHGVAERISFQEMSLFDPLVELLPQKYDVLVSNPPYVSAKEWEQLAPEICQFEPRVAVSDSSDGYEFYRRIAQLGRDLLLKNGSVLVEVGHGQASHVQDIFEEAGIGSLSAVNDLQGVPRVVMGVCP